MNDSQPSIILYGFPQSTYVRTARMACVEKELDYQLEGLDFKSAAHGRLHPYLKMPAADINSQPLFETLAITYAINGLTPDHSLVPSTTMEQAIMLQWISATLDYINPQVLKPALGDTPDKNAWIADVGKNLIILNRQLSENSYFAGDALSLADLFIYPILAMSRDCVPDFELLLKEQNALRAWLTAMAERPSAQQTQA